MKMNRREFIAAGAAAAFASPADEKRSEVFFTKEITPASIVKLYRKLGLSLDGKKVAVKISTGEAGNNHYLHPELIGEFVKSVKGDIVECNTAYNGRRHKSQDHWKVIAEHGFPSIAKVVILDEHGETEIPTPASSRHLKSDLIGKEFLSYDGFAILNHFKGHQMGGFGGALKNLSIGVASARGKARIHTAGKTDEIAELWPKVAETEQIDFIEAMAEAAGAVVKFMAGRAVYISVMNYLSIDCDCNGHPAKPELPDIGVLASLDPVALDQACVDLIYKADSEKSASLRNRMEKQLGPAILPHAEKLGIGTRRYRLVTVA